MKPDASFIFTPQIIKTVRLVLHYIYKLVQSPLNQQKKEKIKRGKNKKLPQQDLDEVNKSAQGNAKVSNEVCSYFSNPDNPVLLFVDF